MSKGLAIEMDSMASSAGIQGQQEASRLLDDDDHSPGSRLDQATAARPASPTVSISKVVEQAGRNFWITSATNALLIGLWYLFSVSITVYNKWMFKEVKDGEAKSVFPFPLFTTCIHMIVQFSLASIILRLFPRFRPHNGRTGRTPVEQPGEEQKRPVMSRWFYLTRIGPCGAATGLDIGLGNMSFKFITLTFYTMCKSSVLGFVLLFAILFRLETPSWRLFGVIVTMTIGVVMMVAGEAAFHALGFILVMLAAASSGFRWSLTQILLIRHPATSNPFSSIFFLAPFMFTTLLILAIPVEGLGKFLEAFLALCEKRGSVLGVLILLFPGCLAFLMTASEFALLQRTSVVTLSICGIFKEVVTISTASIVFHDKLTPINVTGLFITIATIGIYNYMKIKQMRTDAIAEARQDLEQGYTTLASDHMDGGDEITYLSSAEFDDRTGHPGSELGGGYRTTPN